MRASKEILANEIGVVFRKPGERREPESRRAYDPGRRRHRGQHPGRRVPLRGRPISSGSAGSRRALGLGFQDIGRRRHGTSPTLFFCDELIRLYGSDDYPVSQAASYAVENWAAAGFWRELIDGLSRYNERTAAIFRSASSSGTTVSKAQHALHTQEELEQYYFEFEVEEDAFIRYGNEMLDGVAAFWDGLDAERRGLA